MKQQLKLTTARCSYSHVLVVHVDCRPEQTLRLSDQGLHESPTSGVHIKYIYTSRAAIYEKWMYTLTNKTLYVEKRKLPINGDPTAIAFPVEEMAEPKPGIEGAEITVLCAKI